MPSDTQNQQTNAANQGPTQETPEKNSGKTGTVGKKQGSANYRPAENMKMIEVATMLHITSSEGEKDKVWTPFVEQVHAGLPNGTLRTSTAGAEHFKEMVKVIHSFLIYKLLNGNRRRRCSMS